MLDRSKLPPSLRDQTDEDDVWQDVENSRGRTMEERARILHGLCALAAELIGQHADPQRTLDWKDPVPPEGLALWNRLRDARGR